MGVESKIKSYIKTWEQRCYRAGIPDEAPAEIADKVPSYKSIALALLKNDLNLTGLGYTAKESKFYGIYKRIEIEARKYPGKQLKFRF